MWKVMKVQVGAYLLDFSLIMSDLGNTFGIGFGQAFQPKLIEGKALLRCRMLQV